MLFGTDGMRGKVNEHPITPDIVLRFGTAIGKYLSDKKPQMGKNRVIIAKDTRLSGYLIESALTAGLLSAGINVVLVGPMPTPAVPMLIKSLRADFGIMITASHNPSHDNGLKLFTRTGHKISDPDQTVIQECVYALGRGDDIYSQILVKPDYLGRAMRLNDAIGRYIEYVKGIMPRQYSLEGFRIILDCANGATYKVAPTIMWELGAEVINMHCEPNGLNINEDCGSMYPKTLTQKVLETRANIGIAFDGDGDRVVICDERGRVVPGDYVIAIIALYLKAHGKLQNNSVIVNVLSNTALLDYLQKNDIKVFQSKVGDKHIAAEMQNHQCNFGAEESGHIIVGDYNNTGDGIVGALHVLSALIYYRKKASELFDLFELKPQITSNVRFEKQDPLTNGDITVAIGALQKEYPDVRCMVRRSGTERVVRIMLEGPNVLDIKQMLIKIEKILETGSK